MQKSTNTEFRLNVVCPHCKNLVNMEMTIKTGFLEAEPEPKTEGKDNAESRNDTKPDNKPTESADVRPDNPEGKTGTTDSVPEPTDSGKSKANKRSGGKTK